MKKLLLTLLVVSVLAGCKKDEAEVSIKGKWKLIQRKDVGNPTVNDMASYEFNDTYTITDNSFSIDFGNDALQDDKGVHTWGATVTDSKITLNGNPVYYQYFEIQSVSETELKVRPYYKDAYSNPPGKISNLSVDYELLQRVN